MGFISRLLGMDRVPEFPFDTYDAAQRVLPAPYEPWMGAGIPVADPGVPLPELHRARVEAVWRTQPNVRKVVDFCARNIAGIPLHTFERVSDSDRRRVTDHVLSRTLGSPEPRVSPFRFWHAVLSDGLLYDKWAVIMEPRDDGGMGLVRVPAWRLKFDVDALGRVIRAWFWVGEALTRQADDVDGWRKLDLDLLMFDHGYAPKSAGLSPLETLADVLAESAEAVTYRRQVWNNGARVPAWIERPAGATWSPEAKERFGAGFRAAFTGDGPNAGGVPLLEDGMKLHSADAFKPQDTQDLEGRRLTAIEVAAAYHIAPELVGAQQGNYSNVREFRQMLYRDSLGPYIAAWEGAINAQLVPELAGDRSLYVEANVESKLRGAFEDQAQYLQSATGAPYMTRGEARSRLNLPEIDGADELVVPLNVLTGGQASPRDSGSQNLSARGAKSVTRASSDAPLKVKAKAREEDEATSSEVLRRFFKRQRKTVLSAIGGKAVDEWWDEDRWNGELADDLYALAVTVSQGIATETLDALGVDPDVYSVARTRAFLRAVAESRAGAINSTTRDQIRSALAGDLAEGAEGSTPAGVFDLAESTRADQGGRTLATTLASFATTEVGRQLGRPGVTKTWVVTSGNPRPSHASMNGETVGIDDLYSNGMAWPGDSAGGVDEVAGCSCISEITIP
jgi:HK97 family phage portal protein